MIRPSKVRLYIWLRKGSFTGTTRFSLGKGKAWIVKVKLRKIKLSYVRLGLPKQLKKSADQEARGRFHRDLSNTYLISNDFESVFD